MNYKILAKLLGKIMVLEGALMTAPLLVSLIYREGMRQAIAFLLPALVLLVLGFAAQRLRPVRNTLYQKEGFALVALAWIVMTLFGAVPFVINGDIPNYIDACFEIMSGFTTTGASVIGDITTVFHSTLFWRSFSHWIGGMGILVFILIFIPEGNEGSSMHLLRAESPGPQVGKLVSKMKVTTRILYLIYLGLTLVEIIILLFAKPIPGYESDHVFNSILAAFGCAGTGGFGFIPGSIELFPAFAQYVMAIFMLLFGCNFALYYLILVGKIKDVLQSEELRTYCLVVFAAVAVIFVALMGRLQGATLDYSGEEAFRHSFFQVASILTTTGYTTADFNTWPMISLAVIVFLMFLGGMAGSTAGGTKISRFVIGLKGFGITIRKLINPRYVPHAKLEGKTLSEKTITGVYSYYSLYFILLLLVVFLLSFDPVCGRETEIVLTDGTSYTVTHGFTTNFTASMSCLCNIGPGFEAVGPYASFAAYSGFSKILLTITMLVGRLEILPVLVLFSAKTWKKN